MITDDSKPLQPSSREHTVPEMPSPSKSIAYNNIPAKCNDCGTTLVNNECPNCIKVFKL